MRILPVSQLLILSLAASAPVRAAETPGASLRALNTVGVSQAATGGPQELKSWSMTELQDHKAHKEMTRHEKDPVSGKVVGFQGVQLSILVDEALKTLTADQRAQIDLVVLKGDKGSQALVPRWFIQKYPVLVALSRDHKTLGEQGPLYSVVPWTSVSKISKEAVPLESFFVAGLQQIEFANYKERFGRYYLKRRSDPAAIRGEKLFVQSCATCHAAGSAPGMSLTSAGAAPAGATALAPATAATAAALDTSIRAALDRLAAPAEVQKLGSVGHPAVPGMSKLSDREIRSLSSYFDAFRAETGVGAPQGGAPTSGHAEGLSAAPTSQLVSGR